MNGFTDCMFWADLKNLTGYTDNDQAVTLDDDVMKKIKMFRILEMFVALAKECKKL